MPFNRIYSPDNPVGYEVTLTREIAAPRKLVFAEDSGASGGGFADHGWLSARAS